MNDPRLTETEFRHMVTRWALRRKVIVGFWDRGEFGAGVGSLDEPRGRHHGNDHIRVVRVADV